MEIVLAFNNLDGTIPTDIKKLSELRTLNLRNNKLSGMLQHAVFQIHTLQYIDLSGNSITGPLPTKLSMPNLTLLFLTNEPPNWQYSCCLECTKATVFAALPESAHWQPTQRHFYTAEFV